MKADSQSRPRILTSGPAPLPGTTFTPQAGWGAQVSNGNSLALPDRNLEIETIQDTNAVLQTLINDLRSAGILTT